MATPIWIDDSIDGSPDITYRGYAIQWAGGAITGAGALQSLPGGDIAYVELILTDQPQAGFNVDFDTDHSYEDFAWTTDSATAWASGTKTVAAGGYTLVVRTDSASGQVYVPTLPTGMTFVTEVEGWSEITIGSGFETGVSLWQYGPVTLGSGWTLPTIDLPAGLDAGATPVAEHASADASYEVESQSFYWNGEQWSGAATNEPVYLYVHQTAAEANPLLAMLALGSPVSIETATQKQAKLRKVGFTKRGAETLLAALEVATPTQVAVIDDGDYVYWDTGRKVTVSSPFTGPGAISGYNNVLSPTRAAILMVLPDDFEDALPGPLQTLVPGPGTYRIGLYIDGGDAYGVELVDQLTADEVQSILRELGRTRWEEQGASGLSEVEFEPDWNTILRRGDLSPRQVKTLRSGQLKATPPSTYDTSYQLLGWWAGGSFPATPPGGLPSGVGEQDYSVLPVGAEFTTYSISYMYNDDPTVSGTPAAGWLYGRSFNEAFDTLLDPPPNIGSTANNMRSLLRGGFTRHQAKLILKEIS